MPPSGMLTGGADGCVCYVGSGSRWRQNEKGTHPVFPSPEYQLKIANNLSDNDARKLEGVLINELGHILDTDNPPGCLVNIRRSGLGARCCALTPAQRMRRSIASGAQLISLINIDGKVVGEGLPFQLQEQFDVDPGIISQCMSPNPLCSSVYSSTLNEYLYPCLHSEKDTFKVPRPSKHVKRSLIIIATNLTTGESLRGTASELSSRISCYSNHLHAICVGQRTQTHGWTAHYERDELASRPLKLTASSFNFSTSQRKLIAMHIESGLIIEGTAAEIGADPNFYGRAEILHAVAQGKQKTTRGWTARYIDDIGMSLEELSTPAYSFY